MTYEVKPIGSISSASFFQSIGLSIEKSEKKMMTHVMNCRPSVIICIYSSSY